jgi:hypothetical protein
VSLQMLDLGNTQVTTDRVGRLSESAPTSTRLSLARGPVRTAPARRHKKRALMRMTDEVSPNPH